MYAKTAIAQPTFQRHVAEMARAMAEEHSFRPTPPEMLRHAAVAEGVHDDAVSFLAELEVGQ
jgi:hypothetical protein